MKKKQRHISFFIKCLDCKERAELTSEVSGSHFYTYEGISIKIKDRQRAFNYECPNGHTQIIVKDY